jgi:hypothetical protein
MERNEEFTVYDYEAMAEDAHAECSYCGNNASHYGDDGEPTCLKCLREKHE